MIRVLIILIPAAWCTMGIAAMWLMDERFETDYIWPVLRCFLLGPFLLLAVLIVMLLDACEDAAREGR